MPKLSIIIPFYNVESYIDECLKSVLNQTVKDIEVILINDASTDKTRKIVQKYADKDARIKIIDIDKQQGQGFARNRGIEAATGEYIGFVDSDDFVEKTMFKTLYDKAKETSSDITMCQVSEFDDMNKTYSMSDYYSLKCLEEFGDNVFSSVKTKNNILDINVALWNKIYKKEYLLKTKEKFPEGFIYEDLPFFFGTYLPAKRISIVWKSLYNYRINRKNSTMVQFNNKILDRAPMVALTYEKLKKTPFFNEIKKQVQGWIINDLFHRYTLLKENYHREYFFLMKKAFKNLDIENIEDEYWKHIYHFQGYLLTVNNSFEDFNQKVFNEYLDIHKVEDRIKSGLPDSLELDRRFNGVYEDLNKTYKYSEKLREESKNQIVFSIAQTDEKISKVYDEISKNYEYTNEKNDELKNVLNQSISDNNNFISSQTDEKISKVYDEISKNYKYTNEKNDELKNVLNQSISDNNNFISSQTDEKISKVYDEIFKNSKTTELIKKETEEKISNLSDSTNKQYKEIENNINSNIEKVNEKFDEITKQTDDRFLNINNNINKQYETLAEENNNLHNLIKSNEQTLNERIEIKTNQLNEITNKRISEVYDEISKNYDYTNEKNNELNTKLTEKEQNLSQNLENKANFITEQTNERISEVYNEISKNYDFTNAKHDEVINYTNKQISDIYKEITKNYDYTNEKNNELKEKSDFLYTDIKDLSYILKMNIDDITQEQNRIKEETNNKITEFSKNNEEKISNLNKEYSKVLNTKITEFSGQISKTEQNINNSVNAIQNEIENNKKNNKYVIEQLKKEFIASLEQQKTFYEQEISLLKEELSMFKEKYNEDRKSPVVKLIEKYIKKKNGMDK